MATTPGYDPKKAALFNQLRQGGLSEDAAAAQAGITDAPFGTYAVGDNGQMGSAVAGVGKVAGVDFVAPTAAETAESARFDRGLQSPANFEQVDYALEAKNPPSKVTPINYTTTSTETVSGGGSNNTVSGAPQPTPASRSLQPAIDAKQAELQQFNRDNPSNLERKKQGLPLLTAEENQARSEQALALSKEKEALKRKQENAEAPGTPTVTTVPNTTTTTTTTTTGTTSVDTAVQSPDGSDPVINRQTEQEIGVAVGASNVQTAPVAVENNESVSTPPPPAEVTESVFDPANVEPNSDPFEQARFEAEQAADIPPNEIVLTPDEQAAADDPIEQRRLELEQEANREELAREENLNVTNDDPDANRITIDAATEAEQAANRRQLQAEDAQELAAQQSATLDKARAQNTIANQRRNPNNGDWRVKLQLAPGANYLYNDPSAGAGILAPLRGIGIIFPYTPTIATTYKATYSSYDLTHSNYKGYYYQGSQVEPVTLSCPFTAQSTKEAEYLLAVIHFFKSVTKMFYGQDPERGTPPPLVYLTGLGEFQFNEHPCVVQSFTYDLPADVDYIRARSPNVNNSNMLNKRQSTNATGPGTTWGNGILGNFLGGAINRLANAGLPKGGMNTQPAPASFGQNSPTYVPTKMTIAISLLPVQSRKQQSQDFSLRQYANGDLLKGGFW